MDSFSLVYFWGLQRHLKVGNFYDECSWIQKAALADRGIENRRNVEEEKKEGNREKLAEQLERAKKQVFWNTLAFPEN